MLWLIEYCLEANLKLGKNAISFLAKRVRHYMSNDFNAETMVLIKDATLRYNANLIIINHFRTFPQSHYLHFFRWYHCDHNSANDDASFFEQQAKLTLVKIPEKWRSVSSLGWFPFENICRCVYGTYTENSVPWFVIYLLWRRSAEESLERISRETHHQWIAGGVDLDTIRECL